MPEDWQGKPAKLSQRDRDARWTVKTTKAKRRKSETPMVDLAIPEFGYQNHISADRRHRLIRRWLVTDAAAHAGARLADLLDPGNTASAVWADTGYRSKKNEDLLRQRMLVSHIHRKKPAGRSMPDRTARALMALSGFINPYPGKLGVVEEGALADLLLVEGNPLQKLDLVADPDKNFLVIMKDGKIYKNTLTP